MFSGKIYYLTNNSVFKKFANQDSIIKFTNDINNSLDKSAPTIAVFFGLSKAFHTNYSSKSQTQDFEVYEILSNPKIYEYGIL